MTKVRLLFALVLIMLVAAIGIATVAILGAVEDCGPSGDCNISSSPNGLVQCSPPEAGSGYQPERRQALTFACVRSSSPVVRSLSLSATCDSGAASAATVRAVITLNGNEYRLVLLDTNALSEFAKQGESFRHFLAWSSAQPMFVPCFSLFSVLEMRRRPDVYGRFKELSRYCPACS